ncbi:MAG: AzlC family ABC transporter permease [Caldilineaceae bacterium]
MSARVQFWAGVRAESPLLIGVVPFGLIYGITAVAAGMPPVMAQAVSAIIFAGSAQFVAAQLIAAGAPGLVIVATVFVVNLRHMLYSASLSHHLAALPMRWRALLAYLLTDEAYAASITHYPQLPTPAHKGWHLLGTGLARWISWQLSTAAGVFLGASVPPSWPLDFALPLTFIALLVPAIVDRASIAAAVAAGITVLLAMQMPFKLGLIVAAMVGMVVGLAVEQRQPVAHTEEQAGQS